MEKMRFKRVILFLIFTLEIVTSTDSDLDQLIAKAENNETHTLLSRSKRYLIFPDGSSFQLVFCAQNQGYLQIGNIVWFGNTAALAWELPTDPSLFHFLKKYKKDPEALRRQDSKHVVFLDEDGKVLTTMPYKRKKIIVNPAFAKRSIDDTKKSISIKHMHEKNKEKSHTLLDGLDVNSIDFHRTSRHDLYEKLETFIEALGWRGKDCILRMICESANYKNEKQGSFFEEIIRASFTLPKNQHWNQRDYDLANQHGDCAKLYSKCEDLGGSSVYSTR